MPLWIERGTKTYTAQRIGPFEQKDQRFRDSLNEQLAIANAHNSQQPRVGVSPGWQLVTIADQ